MCCDCMLILWLSRQLACVEKFFWVKKKKKEKKELALKVLLNISSIS